MQDKKSLKKFGMIMGAAFLVAAAFILFKHKNNIFPVLIISGIFFTLASIAPVFLGPVYIIWMKFAFILNWINTRLILFVIFYLVFTPIGLIIRLLRKDLLDKKIDKNKESYWHNYAAGEGGRLSYGRQF